MANEGLDLSSVISRIMSDPEMMKTVMGLGEKLNGGGSTESAPEEKSEEKPNEIRSGPPQKSDPRINLLIAMKPFLSRERQGMVDNIVRFSRLGSILGGLTGMNT